MAAPNVIFCSLQNAGASGIDPILQDLLAAKGYFLTPYGPEETTARFRSELAGGRIRQPFYHWTHDAIGTFDGLVGKDGYRFVYLHRDPRDVAVSITFDYQKRGFAADRTFEDILEMIVLALLPVHVKEARQWVDAGSLVITFEQMKTDMPGLIGRVLPHIDYAVPDPALPGRPLSPPEIAAVIDKHSFERVTGRNRGDDGEIIRSQYMFRKGVSGEWKKHFSQDLARKCDVLIGADLRALGYPPG